MSEHEYITRANAPENTNERPPIFSSTPAEAQPLILYDLATLVGVVYQQRITLTRQGKVTKRFADLLRPLLHGSSWNDEIQEDTYINMLCEAAKQLKLIHWCSSYDDDEDKPYYRPVTPKQLSILLNKYPMRYRQSEAGRWTLVKQVYALSNERGDDDPLPSSSIATPFNSIAAPGRYVIFDLETTGDWNGPGQPSDIELLQVAGQRYEHYLPVDEPFISFVKPSGPSPHVSLI